MHRLARPLFLATALVTLMSAVEPAAAAKWCLQGRQWGFPGNCQFQTRAQCMATASGTNSTCGINPRYAFARQRHFHRGYGY